MALFPKWDVCTVRLFHPHYLILELPGGQEFHLHFTDKEPEACHMALPVLESPGEPGLCLPAQVFLLPHRCPK
jgi:hypothetical protein